MFVCSIPAAAVVMLAALLIVFGIASREAAADDVWRLVAHLLSPGIYVMNFYEAHTAYKGMDFTPLLILIGTDFVFYFCLVFGFAIWADRRWRRRRAERMIPDETS